MGERSATAARPRVFLDTSVLKDAASRVLRGFKRQRTFILGGATLTVPLTRYRIVPVVRRPTDPMAEEAALLPLIAHLAKRGRIELVWHYAAVVELMRQPNTDSLDGTFYGAPLTWFKDPPPGGNLSRSPSPRGALLEQIRSRQDRRFLELQVAVGVKEGSKRIDNQLLDAWHLWCSELAGADYFLTADRKLIRHLQAHRRYSPSIHVVTPRELLFALLRRREVGSAEFLWSTLAILRERFWPRTRSGAEQLADFGAMLERQGHYDTDS